MQNNYIIILQKKGYADITYKTDITPSDKFAIFEAMDGFTLQILANRRSGTDVECIARHMIEVLKQKNIPERIINEIETVEFIANTHQSYTFFIQ
jgi:hypothetical protein